MLIHRYFCISLRSSVDRRKLMMDQFHKAGIEAEFFDGILIPEGNPRAAAEAEGVSLGKFARSLTRGELGCYFSHRRLWRALVESNCDAFVIMEDDMVLEDGFRETVETVLSGKWDFDLVRLGPLRPHERSYMHVDLGIGRRVYWTKRTALGMGCYTITKEAARAMLHATSTIVGPVDYDVDRCWVHSRKVQLVYPVAARIMNLPTTIEGRVDDRDRTIGFHEKWWRRYTKHRYRLSVTMQRLGARRAAQRDAGVHAAIANGQPAVFARAKTDLRELMALVAETERYDATLAARPETKPTPVASEERRRKESRKRELLEKYELI
ncbi:glycosyltransferase family 25 protein [Paraburkholderia sp. J12]|uniref:glycosyltransferase family 25 protein n=1 Tax=Paraburkholderia sp. J12 TaxID=2805432 RepID=UPI002ABD7EFC|nr:glycosyltransferase family 25 protein [Paraburkholderia sp. J12]